MRRRSLLALPFCIALLGCPFIAKWLPSVITTIAQAGEVLDAIETTANVFFQGEGAQSDREKFAHGMAKTRLALGAVSHAAKGAQHSDRQDVDKAWQEFQKAYQDILALLGPLGVVTVTEDGSFGASADGPLKVPSHTALRFD